MKIIYCFLLISINIFGQEPEIPGEIKLTIPKHQEKEILTITKDCNEYIGDNYDKITDEHIIGGKESFVLDEMSFFFILSQDKKNVCWIINVNSCVEEDAVVKILFRDGTRTQLENAGKFNCRGRLFTYFGDFGYLNSLEYLLTKEIEAVRVITSTNTFENDFLPSQSVRFKNIMNCLASYL